LTENEKFLKKNEKFFPRTITNKREPLRNKNIKNHPFIKIIHIYTFSAFEWKWFNLGHFFKILPFFLEKYRG